MNEVKIGKVIKSFLKDKKLGLRELAVMANIPYSTLYSWQENRSPKDIEKAKRLANILKITVDELIFGLRENTEEVEDDEVFKTKFEVTIRVIK